MGVYKSIKDRINPFVYLRETILTEPSDSLKDLARKSCRDQKKIEKLEQQIISLQKQQNKQKFPQKIE